jgi:hypothetical protein
MLQPIELSVFGVVYLVELELHDGAFEESISEREHIGLDLKRYLAVKQFDLESNQPQNIMFHSEGVRRELFVCMVF